MKILQCQKMAHRAFPSVYTAGRLFRTSLALILLSRHSAPCGGRFAVLHSLTRKSIKQIVPFHYLSKGGQVFLIKELLL